MDLNVTGTCCGLASKPALTVIVGWRAWWSNDGVPISITANCLIERKESAWWLMFIHGMSLSSNQTEFIFILSLNGI